MTTRHKGKLPLEMYDKVNYMCRNYMDRMARFELDYPFKIDPEAFKVVTARFLEKALVFRSILAKSPITPFWRVSDYNIDDAVIVSQPEDLNAAREEFFSQEIPTSSNLQIKIALFFHKETTCVCFIWNHMCMDGGGFKSFWSDFCGSCTDYINNAAAPVRFSDGSRAFSEVYSDLSKENKARAKKLFAACVSPKDKHRFPFSKGKENCGVVMVSKEIADEIFIAARNVCKKESATVNDLLIASYIDALGKLIDIKEDEAVSIAYAVDLRRYIKDTSRIGYTNHVSFAHCSLSQKGGTIIETLRRVASINAKTKQDPFMGLHGLPLLNFGYKSMIYAQAELVIKAFYKNPPLAVSNVGALDAAAFSLCGNEPCGVFVAGAAKNKPCAMMTALTLKDNLFLSICVRGNEEDRKILEQFFDEIEKSIIALSKP